MSKSEFLNSANLSDILTYHVIQGKTVSSALLDTQTVQTVNGEMVTIEKTDRSLLFGSVEVIMADVLCSNGVIHVVNYVALPPSWPTTSTTTASTGTTDSGRAVGSSSVYFFLALFCSIQFT